MNKADEKGILLEGTVHRYSEFGDVVLDMDPDTVLSSGLEFGDSVDAEFGCGYVLRDLPFLNGYYGGYDRPVFCAYPSYSKVSVAYCGGRPTWTAAGTHIGDSVRIRLRERGRYRELYDILGNTYTCDRNDYPTDEAYANFREVKIGGIKEKSLYRGVSPCQNTFNRAAWGDRMIAAAGVRFAINLTDTADKLAAHMKEPDCRNPYYSGLLASGAVCLAPLTVDYKSAEYRRSLAAAFRAAIDAPLPVYVHCVEGKDRTGFFCVLAEALLGAAHSELEEDYMQSYVNYYGLEPHGREYDRVRDIFLNCMLSYIFNGTDDCEAAVLREASYKEGASKYLTDCGLAAGEIDSFIRKFGKED